MLSFLASLGRQRFVNIQLKGRGIFAAAPISNLTAVSERLSLAILCGQ